MTLDLWTTLHVRHAMVQDPDMSATAIALQAIPPSTKNGLAYGRCDFAFVPSDEDDDIDVYSTSEYKPSRRLAYEDDSADTERLTLNASKNDRKPLGNRPNAPVQNNNVIQNFHDGRPVLGGFILSEKPIVEDIW